jgi:hypothetical protein
MNISIRSLIGSATLAVVLFILLILPGSIPGGTGAEVREKYSSIFRLAAELCTRVIGIDDVVKFRSRFPNDELFVEGAPQVIVRSRPDVNRPMIDTHIYVGRLESGFVWKFAFRAWVYTWHPIAVVLALALATPFGFRKRILTAFAGVAALQAYIALRTVVVVMGGVHKRDSLMPNFLDEAKPLIEWAERWPELLKFASMIVHESPTGYVAPIIVWGCITWMSLKNSRS